MHRVSSIQSIPCFFLLLLTDTYAYIGIVHRVSSQTHGECSENEERYPPLRARDLYNCTGCLGQGAGRYVCSILRISDRCTLFRLFKFSRAPLRPATARRPARVSFSSCRERASRSIVSSRGDQSLTRSFRRLLEPVRQNIKIRTSSAVYVCHHFTLSVRAREPLRWSVRNTCWVVVRRDLTSNRDSSDSFSSSFVWQFEGESEHIGVHLHPDLFGYRLSEVRYHRVASHQVKRPLILLCRILYHFLL